MNTYYHSDSDELTQIILKLILSHYPTLGWPRDVLHDYENLRLLGPGVYAYAISTEGAGTHMRNAAIITAESSSQGNFDYYVITVQRVEESAAGVPAEIYGTMLRVTREVILSMPRYES